MSRAPSCSDSPRSWCITSSRFRPLGVPEAIAVTRVLSLHVPVLLAAQALRATLEGAQRFDISTALRIPGSLASVVIPAIVAPAGGSLATILWLAADHPGLCLLMSVDAVRRVLLRGRWSLHAHWRTLREMLGYSVLGSPSPLRLGPC